jgi:cytochrome c-type biogenesis protein CcmH
VKRPLQALLVAFALLACTAAGAKEAAPLAQDQATEQRMVDISEELRCLVCQNESLAASRADLAQDLRREIRELIKAGKSDREIMDYMVGRYGDFVRYRPPVKSTTWLLWFGPFLLLLIALFVLVNYLRNRSRRLAAGANPDNLALSAEEQAKADDLLRPAGATGSEGTPQ